MKARKANFCGRCERFSEAMSLVRDAGDYVEVHRGVLRSIVMRCPDDCGETITVNLDARSGPAWRLYRRNGKLTVYPSVWKQSGCCAHFILWNDHIMWLGTDDPAWRDTELIEAVLSALPASSSPARHYFDVANQLDAIPWEVLWACQFLESRGSAMSFEKGTTFRRSEKSNSQTPTDGADVIV